MIAPPSKAEKECVEYLKTELPRSLLDEADSDFLSDATYLRFARARDGDKTKALHMLKKALEWRKEFKPFAIQSDDVAKVMKEMTMTCGGRCRTGRPLLVMKIAVPNQCSVEERVKQLVYILEVTQRKGYENVTWIVDFGEMGKHERDPRSSLTRKQTMDILQNYYPERLGMMLLYRLPWYASALFTMVKPFLDKRTRNKIFKAGKHLADLDKYVDRSQLPVSLGGTLPSDGLLNLEQLPPYNAPTSGHYVDDKAIHDGEHAFDENSKTEEP